jgi:hypothetical protein
VSKQLGISPVVLTSMELVLPTALGPGIYIASKRIEYQKQKNNVSGD